MPVSAQRVAVISDERVVFGDNARLNATPLFPGLFNLTHPVNGAQRLPRAEEMAGWGTQPPMQPALRWSRPRSFHPLVYNVGIATDPGFVNIVFVAVGLSQRQLNLIPGMLGSRTQYYWQVVAQNVHGNTASSPFVGSFTTGGPFCPGDANDSGSVNFADITTALSNFGAFCP